MRISDWSSDVCSSDLGSPEQEAAAACAHEVSTMNQPENPLDVFRRTTAATVRAIAELDDINVTFAPRGQGLVGKEVKVTLPARSLPPEDAAQIGRAHV